MCGSYFNLFQSLTFTSMSLSDRALLHETLCRLSTGQRSFAFRGAKLWNYLNHNIKSLKCPKDFKRHFANVVSC